MLTKISIDYAMPPSTINGHGAMPVYKIASIPADGIGPEVISAGIQVLEKLSSVLGEFDFDFDHIEWGSDYYKKHGRYIPEGGIESLKQYNAIFFGSVGALGTAPPAHRGSNPLTAVLQTFLTTSPSGASASPSANPSNNTPTSAQPASSGARSRPSRTVTPATLTGS